MRYSGLPLATSSSRANNTPYQTPLCPKRRPPRPQQPIFSIFRRGGLHFEHHTTTNRDLTTTKRGNFATRGSDTSATRHQKASCRKPHQRQCGGCRRTRLRCPWAAAGPGRASRRRTERSSRRGRLAGGPPPTGTPSSPAQQHTTRRPEHRRRNTPHRHNKTARPHRGRAAQTIRERVSAGSRRCPDHRDRFPDGRSKCQA